MAPRKAIVRIGPQPTSFEDSLFTKGVGGYNWQYDRVKNVFRRRPGTYLTCPAIDEGSLFNLRTLSGSDPLTVTVPNGITGLASFDRPLVEGASDRYAMPAPPGDYNDTVGIRKTTTTLVAGNFPWLVLTVRVFQALKNLTVRVFDTDEGVKTVSITTPESVTVTLQADATNTAYDLYLALVAADFSAASLAPSGFGNKASLLQYLPYGTSYIQRGAYFESVIVTPIPTSDIGGGSVESLRALGTLRSTRSDNDQTPLTVAKRGNYAYLAGGGSPLMRFDGSRVHVAGASPLIGPFATLGVTGTGITGTFSYRIMHRVYGPDGSYVDGEPQDLESITATNDTVVITFNRNSMISNMFSSSGSVSATVDGVITTTGAMYKCTDFISVGDVGGGASDIRLNNPGYSLRGRMFAGDPLFTWDGSELLKQRVVAVDETGLIQPSFGVVPFTDRVCAGDVFVIMRTVDGGSIYYEVAEIPVGLASYSDTMSDATLVTRPQYLELAYSKLPPPSSTVAVCTHQTRLVVAHRPLRSSFNTQDHDMRLAAAQLSWSEADTEHFPVENSVDLSGLCSKITGLASLNDILYVLTDKGVFYVQGTLSSSPQTYTFGRLPGSVACASPASVVVAGQQVWFITTRGELAKISGLQVECERNLLPASGYEYSQVTAAHDAEEDRSYFFVTENNPADRVSQPAISSTYAYADTDYNYSPYGTSGLCLVVDHEAKNRFIYRDLCGIGGATIHNGCVIFADRDQSRVSQLRTLAKEAASDSGTNIPIEIVSPFEDGTTPHLQKTFQRLTVFAPNAESQFTLGVRVEKDWDERYYIQDFEQEFRTDEGYAVEPYATDPYGDGVIPDRSQDLEPVNAKSLRVTLTHEDKTEVPVINGWVLEYSDTTNEGREE